MGAMSHTNDTYGAEIRVLLADLTRLPSAMCDPSLASQISALRQEISGRAGPLASAEYRRDELKEERRWIASDVHGFQRALVLVGPPDGAPGPDGARSAQRLRTKLESRVARTLELTEEIEEFQQRIDHLDALRLALSAELVEMLRHCVQDTEQRARAVDLARRKRLAALRVEMGDTEGATMWSPTAVHGYRVWSIEKDGLYGARRRWRSTVLSAECSWDGEIPHTDGRCADVAFGCGIYAAKTVEALMGELGSTLGKTFVVGLVGLEGRVVEHHRGYRAQRATVLAVAIINRGVLQTIDAAEKLQHLFGDQKVRSTIGAPSLPGPHDNSTMQAAVQEYLDERARRYQTWISGNNNE